MCASSSASRGPTGDARERGLYFVASAPSARANDVMLGRMLGTAGDQIHDRLTDFSRPVTGAYYFAPSLTVLNELAETYPVHAEVAT